MNFTLYTSNTRGDKANCLYPNRIDITNRNDFAQAMQYDHVCGAFNNNYRSNGNFIESNVLAMDCDNDHSDLPTAWVYPEDVAKAFGEVAFAVNYSRNHLRQKGNKSPRPRFHIYFPIPTIKDGSEYSELKKKIQAYFPYFDEGALGEARFFFGVGQPMVDFFEGTRNVASFISGTELINSQCEMRNAQLMEFASQTDLNDRAELDTNIANCELRIANSDSSFTSFEEFDSRSDQIPEGSRNTTMSRVAAGIIKRYGNTDAAYNLFLGANEKCNPPLEEKELRTIWNSAKKFGKRIAQNPDYIPPEIYNSECNLKPRDYSDASQAELLIREYNEKLRYTTATKFIVYNGSFWEESEEDAYGLSLELTERQLEEVEQEIQKLTKELTQNGALAESQLGAVTKRTLNKLSPDQVKCYQLYEDALAYKKFVTKHRSDNAITSALHASIPRLKIDYRRLDADAFALNCPSGTWNLRKGVEGKQEHYWEDYVTKETLVDPGTQGVWLWEEALNTFFQNDASLIEYVKQTVGLVALGKVYVESIIIAYGEGCNGKSTFWNSISRVLGGYSGSISTEILIADSNTNYKVEIADLKGKRLAIAAEMDEGKKFSTGMVKKLCSTDEIKGEKKYKDPFDFLPTHSLVLYTNHLPKITSLDKGTWRRLIVVPFNATIEGNSDIKNYADYLVENAGPAILTWIMEGAQKVIAANYRIELPRVVKEAINGYRENNDWLTAFLEDCCILDENALEKGTDVVNAYRAYCMQVGEEIHSSQDLYRALKTVGVVKHPTNKMRAIKGLRLKTEFNG